MSSVLFIELRQKWPGLAYRPLRVETTESGIINGIILMTTEYTFRRTILSHRSVEGQYVNTEVMI